MTRRKRKQSVNTSVNTSSTSTNASNISSTFSSPIKPKEEELLENSSGPESPGGETSPEDRIASLTKEIEKLEQEIEDLEAGKLDSVVPELYKEMLEKTGATPQSVQQGLEEEPKEEEEEEEKEKKKEDNDSEQVSTKIPDPMTASPQKPTRGRPKQKRTKSMQITDAFPVIKSTPVTPEATEKKATKSRSSIKHSVSEPEKKPVEIKVKEEDKNDDEEEKKKKKEEEKEQKCEKAEQEQEEDDGKEEERIKKVQKKLSAIIKYALKKDTGLFDHEVTEEEVPSYTSVIHHGVDLMKIQKNIDEGKYLWPNCRTVNEAVALFARDLMLMFANAFVFNRPGTSVWKFTSDLKRGCFKQLEDYNLWPVLTVTPTKRKAATREEGGVVKKRGRRGRKQH